MSSESGISILQNVLLRLRQEFELSLSNSNTSLDSSSYNQGRLEGIDLCLKACAAALVEQKNTVLMPADLSPNAAFKVSAFLPHPHPRSRIYRSEPLSWQIVDANAARIQNLILAKAQQSTRQPLVIFDLDGTLFDVGYRTLGILKTWLATSEAEQFSPHVLGHVAQIEFHHIGYSLAHAFENAGLDLRDQEVVDVFTAAEKNWRRKFFDGEALVEYDLMMPGAEPFVRTILNAGIRVAYLTGRHHSAMLDGTKAQLRKFNFPVEGCEMLLKKNYGQDDHEFKAETFELLSRTHEVIGNFENEYINIASMSEHKPDCVHVIVDTQHSGRPVPALAHPVYRIDSFLV